MFASVGVMWRIGCAVTQAFDERLRALDGHESRNNVGGGRNFRGSTVRIASSTALSGFLFL
jgi:hypothetical protein